MMARHAIYDTFIHNKNIFFTIIPMSVPDAVFDIIINGTQKVREKRKGGEYIEFSHI